MVDRNRRDFLRNSVLATAALASGQMLPPVIRRALAVEPARVTGTLQDIQHVVILMQENRSFDHYFGTLRGVRGFGDPRPLQLPGGRPVWYQPVQPGGSDYVLPFHLDSHHTNAQNMHDLNHDWKGSHQVWKNHDAWVSQKTPNTMGYFQRDDIPFHHALADAFTVCDGYHASLFGPTSPNRMFLFSGTSGLSVGDDGKQAIDNIDDGNWTAPMSRDKPGFKGFTWTNYAQRLQDAGINWKVYQEFDNYGDNTMQFFAAFRGLPHDSPLYRRGRAWAAGSTLANAKASRGEHLVAQFARDIDSGQLPQVSWIVPPYIMSEHPRATPAYGASMIARLLEALAARPEVWSKTVFLLCYDENDGFFDHVPPPLPALDSSMGRSTIDVSGESYQGVPVGLGPRVPMLVISPWSRGGRVNSQVFDHTSVIRFLEQRFGVHEPNISPWRRAVAGDLTSCLDLQHGELDWPALPDTAAAVALADANSQLAEPRPPISQSLPKQEPGQRSACALPYDFEVIAELRRERGLRLVFSNRSTIGVSLNAYSAGGRIDPRFYTLGAGDWLDDLWPLDDSSEHRYALTIHGPNGYLRSYAGSADAAAAALEVGLDYDAGTQQVLLRLRNDGNVPYRCVVASGYAPAQRRELRVPASATQVSVWNIGAQDHWYDLTITSADDPNYHRRLAGHIETGKPSRSDPAIASA
ncbi:MAG: phospholipase C, phosphocholine-specific [Rhodanobacter sp.]|nr:MAG: phospholipase C, phosphocholine-specific [Rhodanobacter sp.]